MNTSSLNTMRCLRGSRCSCSSSGVMCEDTGVRITSRADMLCRPVVGLESLIFSVQTYHVDIA